MNFKKIFLFLLIKFFAINTTFTQRLHLKVSQNKGYYVELRQYNCNFIKKESKFYINRSDTTINMEHNINFANIILWNNFKEFYYYFPLYFDCNTITIEISDYDNFKNDFDKLNNFKLIFSNNSNDFTDFFRNQKLRLLNNTDLIYENIKNYFVENNENYYALYLLSFSQNYSRFYKNYLDSISNVCKGSKFFIDSFQELDSLKEYSRTYLNFKYFTNDLSKYSKKITYSNKNPKINFNKDGNIYFWASWCKPCLAELFLLSNEEKANENNYFISLDNDTKKCLNAAKKVGLIHNIFITEHGWLNKYQINDIPSTIYYNYQKQILKKIK